VDIIEANERGNQFTMHPCSFSGQHTCEGNVDCGNGLDQIPGVCDKQGCGFNSYPLGDSKFWGPGKDFAVDTTKPVTFVTQFITEDNTDTGDLSEIRRLYIQDGKVIQNSHASALGDEGGDSITDEFCKKASKHFNKTAHNASEAWSTSFQTHGGLKSIGEALDRGMVLAFSIWDDNVGRMLWLDGEKTRIDDEAGAKGIAMGPCGFKDGSDAGLKKDLKDDPAVLSVTDLKYGAIDTTYGSNPKEAEKKFEVVSDAQDLQSDLQAPENGAFRMSRPALVLISAAIACGVAVFWLARGVRSPSQAVPTSEPMELE